MKEIIIKESNAAKIMAAISEAQGRATARTIDSYKQVEYIIECVEKRIGKMPKAALEGTSFLYDFRQHFPKAYKSRPESTEIVCRYSKGSWRLVSVKRDYCPNVNSDYGYALTLSETAKAEILRRYE